MPGMPNTFSHCVSEPSFRSIRLTPASAFGSTVAYACTPGVALTRSPSAKPGWFDASTLQMPPARITSSRPTGGM